MSYRAAIRTTVLGVGLLSTAATAALPAPPADLRPWSIPWSNDLGPMSALKLLPSPAGDGGYVTAQNGHFFQAGKRLRMLGMSICFAAAFPEHAQADKVARRLAQLGCNAIRLHHMDNAAFPVGIFSDGSLEKLSPEALDRLDYFIAALKRNGIYVDLNLHVSRDWARSHHLSGSEQLPDYGKMVDLFDPGLIAPQKQYARDLLNHVNAYTRTRYADETSIAMIEINNEDSLFLWGGEAKIAALPEPYSKELDALWNRWLRSKYSSRDQLRNAWSQGAQPAGPQMLIDPGFSSLGQANDWLVEQQGNARMQATPEPGAAGATGIALHVTQVDDTVWHLQFQQHVAVRAGQYYTLSFQARADDATEMTASVAQAHEPWENLGLAETVQLSPQSQSYRLGFVASRDDDRGRLTFLVGRKATTLHLSEISLTAGGQLTLGDAEDPSKDTVETGRATTAGTAARRRDWYAFLQETEQRFFDEMRSYLKKDLGVKCPITGSIGLGILGTLTQSNMDFVDAHAYWDHPEFPHRQWDMADWTIHNKAMVDSPEQATLWPLAATRVKGKPFTVTEYNHAAPNEWQAECLPMIASYAAVQDWDAVFLFDFAADTNYERDATANFFDFAGNVVQTAGFPMAARIFLGGSVAPLPAERIISPSRETMLDTASLYYYTQWPFVRETQHVSWEQMLNSRVLLDFSAASGAAVTTQPLQPADQVATTLRWKSGAPDGGVGQYILADAHASVFVGFAGEHKPIDAGALRIQSMESPFAAIMLTAADPSHTITQADHLLMSAIARQANTDMKWRDDRRSVSNQWGHAPALIEVVHATVQIHSDRPLDAFALNPDGTRGKALPTVTSGNTTTITLGSVPTLWYELVKR